MSEPTNPVIAPPYENLDTAPLIYFDVAPIHGIVAGVLQVELGARVLIPRPDGSGETKIITTGRLRCSPMAATHLRDALSASLKLLEQAQQNIPPASSLN
jgi:hypothetical protein